MATLHRTQMTTPALTTLAMLAFAGNSLLCRAALLGGDIDPAGFTVLRLGSGALVLWILARALRPSRSTNLRWREALALFVYAICFSFAYTKLTTGTGALLLFAAVQITMVAAGLYQREHLSTSGWLGLGFAFAGFIILILPGVEAPEPKSAALMIVAGVAWGLYSLSGGVGGDPLRRTADNFMIALVPALLVALVQSSPSNWQGSGVVMALLSGAVASGVGYALWYAVLPHLSAIRAAVVQLSVPLLAALAGLLLLGETAGGRELLSTLLILGGIALVIRRRGGKQPANK